VSDRTIHLSDPLPEGLAPVGSYLLARSTGFEVESAGDRSITVRDYPVLPCPHITLLHAAELVRP
jgi:hypothetical protein